MGDSGNRQDACEEDASAWAGAGRLLCAHRFSLWNRDGEGDNHRCAVVL